MTKVNGSLKWLAEAEKKRLEDSEAKTKRLEDSERAAKATKSGKRGLPVVV